MTDKELYNKRIKPALIEMYRQSNGYIDLSKCTFDDIEKAAIKTDNGKVFPYYAFYLNTEKIEEILKKYTKHLHYTYRWPKKIEFGVEDNEFEEYKKELDKIKDLKTKEFNMEMRKIAKRFNLQKRSIDKEKIEFNVLNLAPNSNKEYVENLTDMYNKYLEHPDMELDQNISKYINSMIKFKDNLNN